MKEENNQTNHDKKDKKKIVLNKDIDLYKISIKTIKESKLSDFKGELFNEILSEMLKSEENNAIIPKREINKNNQKILKTLFNSKKNETINQDKNICKSRNNQKVISFNKYYSDNINFKRTKLTNNSYINKKPSLKGKYPGLKEFKIEKIIFQMRYNTQMGEDLAVIGSINELGCWDQGRPLRMNWNDGNIWKGILNFNDNIMDFEYKFIFISRGYVKQWEDGNNRKFILSQIKGLIISWPGDENIIHLKNISGQNIDFNYNDNTLTIICEWNRK